MASKEEIEKRVEQEGARVYGVFIKRIQESAAQGITRGVRPLVERVIELEEEATKHTALTVKLASAEEHVIEQGRTIEVLNSDRSRILADLTEARADLRTAQRELDEERAAHRDVLRGRTMAENTIVEPRAGLAAERRQTEIANGVIEHERRTTTALRAQVEALQGVIDGHELAIKDTASDVRARMGHEILLGYKERDRLKDKLAALETTVDVLAGRLAARGA